MKHINKKFSIMGAGKGAPKPQPAILTPPKLGGFKTTSSYSVAELIDLISDGPIEGLVDQNGVVLRKDIFKGIYLDDTPIQNTLNDVVSYGTVSIANRANAVSSVWMENGKFKDFDGTVRLFLQTIGSRSFSSPLMGFNNDGSLKVQSSASLSSLNNPDGFPLVVRYANNQVEIHRYNPIISGSEILKTFEKTISEASKNNSDKAKQIANQNIKELNKIKQLMNRSKYVTAEEIVQVVRGRSVSGGAKIAETLSNKIMFCVIQFNNFTFSNIKDLNEKTPVDFIVQGLSNKFDYIYTLAQPEFSNKKYSGRVDGIVVMAVPLEDRFLEDDLIVTVPRSFLQALNNTNIAIEAVENPTSIFKSEKFNFNNVSCDFRRGREDQSALNDFGKIFNDYEYNAQLLGPFARSGLVQRITVSDGATQFEKGIKGLGSNLTVSQNSLLNGLEGSQDVRQPNANRPTINDYSNWNNENEKKDYDSLAITHTIENPFVDSVSVSIVINALSDTMDKTAKDVKNGSEKDTLEAGAKIPSIVAIQIETGKITNGNKTQISTYSYSIVGLIEGSCIIDFGSGIDDRLNLLKDSVEAISGGVLAENEKNAKLTQPFNLPKLNTNENPSTTKRYIKIVKLSCETNSTLINKDLALAKVTEVINEQLSYPFSAIVGMKLDARAFGSIPQRSYDCKLKRVKIPSNYRIQNDDNVDVRYVRDAKTYQKQRIYYGDWDGTFSDGWTDNPAWILFDLLTNQRYGLGAYIDTADVNKWELYKIARFCDAVDEEGYFIGVSDGVGGLEPRFSCNILLTEQTKVYDAINIIANLFRGIVFFGGSEIHFLDDRPRKPIALFNNANTKEGVFNYSNVRKDLQFNTVEVVYLDRFDNYKTKVEYVQDEEDIRKRGVLKTTINTAGVTSRAMARRIGQHIIYQTIKENQTVDFSTGLEALLCRPGDLVIVEDEMKTRDVNYGRILDVDIVGKQLRIDNQFNPQQQEGFITVYAPTGQSTAVEFNKLAKEKRSRVEQFTIDKNFLNNSAYSILRGTYKFSGYTDGFPSNSNYPDQFPLYTGTGSAGQQLYCYYNKSATGFVFATGLPFQNNNTYDKIITNTGVFYGADIAALSKKRNSNHTGFVYSSSAANKRSSTSGAISGAIDWDADLYPVTSGILDGEIGIYNVSQITKISFTGYDNVIDYGSQIYLNANDPNINFLPAVKAGGVYRIERKSASDQIYKIIAIRENAQNEYSITATKYDTGKFQTIENAITEDFLENTYYTGTFKVRNVEVNQLAMPKIVEFEGTSLGGDDFRLTGRWQSVTNATGYKVSISNSLAGYFKSETINTTGWRSNLLTDIGNWELSITALGRSNRISSFASTTGTFIAYTGNLTQLNKPIINGFSLQ